MASLTDLRPPSPQPLYHNLLAGKQKTLFSLSFVAHHKVIEFLFFLIPHGTLKQASSKKKKNTSKKREKSEFRTCRRNTLMSLLLTFFLKDKQ